jgi:hypothetical protein
MSRVTRWLIIVGVLTVGITRPHDEERLTGVVATITVDRRTRSCPLLRASSLACWLVHNMSSDPDKRAKLLQLALKLPLRRPSLPRA